MEIINILKYNIIIKIYSDFFPAPHVPPKSCGLVRADQACLSLPSVSKFKGEGP